MKKKRKMYTLDEMDRRFSAGELAEMDRELEAELMELNLRGIRELAGLTQEEIAARTGVSQVEVGRVERREDHKLSTIRRYVEAIGGELELTVRYGNKSFRLVGV